MAQAKRKSAAKKDAISILTEDHAEVKSMFKAFEKLKEEDGMKRAASHPKTLRRVTPPWGAVPTRAAGAQFLPYVRLRTAKSCSDADNA